MAVSTINRTTTGTSSSIQIYAGPDWAGVAVIATLTGTATYNIEVSGNNIQWNILDGMGSLTSSTNGAIMFPVGYARVNILSGSGSVFAAFCDGSASPQQAAT
jgi:hypothetical protein